MTDAPTLVEIEQDIARRIQALINDTVATIAAELGLKDYEAENLREKLADGEHFSEFWFPGSNHGSFKVFLTGEGIPFVYDQYQNKAYVERISALNAKLDSLFKED